MSDLNKKAKMIFEKWKANLLDKDRSFEYVSSNFDEVFYEMYASEIPLDTVHDLIKDIVKCHLPTLSIAQNTYKNSKKDKNFSDWFKEWKDGIEAKAFQSFYSFYNIDEKPKVEEVGKGMSKDEYIAQRKYSSQFPTLTWDDIKKRFGVKEGETGE